MKKIKNYILAFIIPFIICLIILYLKNILFNIENIYVSDLKLQHMPFLNYLKNILLNKASIQYSFSAGLGSPMLATMIFYCISPINILLLLINDIRYAIIFIYITKVSLSGLSMYILLKNKYKYEGFMTIMFSTCYALSSFAINYFFCIFWFDSIYLAPLVMLGIEKIIEKGKISLLYILSLSLAIICNIQMGFGLCIYALIYYIYSYNTNYSIKDTKKLKHLSIIFIISSLCAGAISSGILLAFISEYSNVATARSIQVLTQAGTSNLLYIFKNLFAVGYLKTNYYNEYEPLIYCGLVITFFSLLFFGNKKIDSTKKKHALIVISIFFISFCVDFLNKFWHISSPVLLNYRYSIYLGLFITTLAFENYIKTEKLQKKDLVILSISLVIGLSTIILDTAYVIQSFIFLIVTFILIILTKNKSKKFEILLCLSMITEIIVAGYTSIYTAEDLPLGKSTSYNSLKEVSKLNTFDDNYRVMYNYSYTDYTNDTLLLNKNSSVRYFSSVINGRVLEFFNTNFAASGNNNYRLSAYESPLLLSLLGNKYFYLTEELNNGLYNKIDSYKIKSYNYETKTNESKDIYLYENPYALSLGYVIKKDLKNTKDDNPIDYQNDIIKAFSGIDKDVIIKLDYTSTDETEYCNGKLEGTCKLFTIKNPTNTPLINIYANIKSYRILNTGVSQIYIETNRPMMIPTINKNLEIVLESESDLDQDRFYTLTYDKYNLIESLESLQNNMLDNIKINKNIMSAQIDSSENGILFLSIPYEKNYKIFVDDKKTDYYGLLNNSFVGLDIKKGNHKIKIIYENNSYKLYITLTAISIVITILLYYFINKSITKKQKLEQEKLEEERIKRQLKKENSKKQKNKKRKK